MSDTPLPTVSEASDIAKQLYEQNFQLAVHNKTLGILSKLYEITMSSLDVHEVCQKIVDTLVTELAFQAAILNVVDSEKNQFCPFAITRTQPVIDSLQLLGKSLEEICLPLGSDENIVSIAMRDNERKITGNMLDILFPLADQTTADQIENLTGVKTLIVYPVTLGTKMIGSLVVGLGKKAEDLSKAEKETLEEVIDLIAIAIERAQLHESVEKANEELKALDKLKDEFLSMASHELKSPMNAVKNYLWMALNKGLDDREKQKGYLTVAYDSTQRLIGLVNDLLDVSRIESGRVKLEMVSLDLQKLINETLEIYAPQAKAKNLALSTTLQEPIQITADDMKLREVLNNLVSNAIKYTLTGTVIVSVKVEDKTIRVSVTDSGAGISADDQQKLFQKFSRVNASYKGLATVEGTGLGLYISKQFMEMMGGNIGLDSEVDKGTTFWVELPKS
ncbi:MAG: GAF domain-containing sensor histidine kinase [Candidatus Woesebacteria bacterium]